MGWPASNRPKNTVPSTATPTVPPSCWFAFSTPDAEPTSGSVTPASVMSKNGVMARPSPKPHTANEGASAQPVTWPAVVTVSSTPPSPAAATTAPICSPVRPRRAASTAPDSAEPAAIPNAHGACVSPACSGV